MKIVERIYNLGRLAAPADFVARLVKQGECQTALDIGCGQSSALSGFRPGLQTFGLDASESALEVSRRARVHDHYILGDILKTAPETILQANGGRRFDIVAMFDVIEHVPKRLGLELLEACEQLTSKFVIVVTPNGFLEQGPEFGNEYQRHLSGWFPHDFEGLGYRVHGTSGLKALHGYAGLYRWNIPGIKFLDVGMAHLLNATNRYRFAFSLVAVKDIRGVPARLGSTVS